MRARRTADKLMWKVRLARLRATGGRRVALASFPRSGNTWFRFFLEAATGERTGIAGARQSRVLPRSGDGIVIKTHRRDSHKYTHAIHLVRNPFDAIDSFYDYKASLGWTWRHGALTWEEFVPFAARKWQRHTRHWLRTRTPTYRIRYEDCVRDPAAEFRRLLEWLERPVDEDALRAAIEATAFDRLKRQQAAASEVGLTFFRRGRAGKGIERFSPEQRASIADELAAELRACGYDALMEIRARESTSGSP